MLLIEFLSVPWLLYLAVDLTIPPFSLLIPRLIFRGAQRLLKETYPLVEQLKCPCKLLLPIELGMDLQETLELLKDFKFSLEVGHGSA